MELIAEYWERKNKSTNICFTRLGMRSKGRQNWKAIYNNHFIGAIRCHYLECNSCSFLNLQAKNVLAYRVFVTLFHCTHITFQFLWAFFHICKYCFPTRLCILLDVDKVMSPLNKQTKNKNKKRERRSFEQMNNFRNQKKGRERERKCQQVFIIRLFFISSLILMFESQES